MGAGIGFTSLKPDELTWEQVQRLFLLRCRSKNISPETLKLYERHLRLLLDWLPRNGAESPAQARTPHFPNYLEHCQKERGDKPATVDCVYRLIRTLCRFLHQDGLILLAPSEKLERSQNERRCRLSEKRVHFSDSEERRRALLTDLCCPVILCCPQWTTWHIQTTLTPTRGFKRTF